MDNTTETHQIFKIAGLAFLLNLVLTLLKVYLAIVTGSLAITAGAIDSGTDAVASLVIYGGVKLSTRKTRSFPLGLYKLENVASVTIALFIFIAGYEIVKQIFFSSDRLVQITPISIYLLAGSSLAIFGFGQYALHVGKKTRSPVLIAEGRHRQVDVLSSIVVLVSVMISYFDLQTDVMGISIDRIGAALMLLFIAKTGGELLSDGMRVLLDASIDFPTLNKIRSLISQEPAVDEIKSLIGRNAGRYRFIQADITLNVNDLEAAHKISEAIEHRILTRIPNIENITIHYEPKVRTHDILALPLSDKSGQISLHFGEAPYFARLHRHIDKHTIDAKKIMENPHCTVSTAKGIRVAEWLVDQKITHVAIKEDVSHKGPGYVLSSAGIKIIRISSKHLSGAVREIMIPENSDNGIE
ncbi:cation diffusion facilitator family transporter [Desulfobacter latus]|uniref:Cation diffusion facilitator family transporter n=1 Tax=Desulfobacter latus TaxID=2292 RepID=A0A850T372_9BACT|nr:cation diffusion facilitator family transporter [Desulfobacter latus]NWH06193.1 cation diffusion facilitator family transporter [Desulfobacter latus]